MTLSRLARLCMSLAIAFTGVVHADIYKCVDEGGRITYTNTKTSARGCTVLSRDLPQAKRSRPSSSSESSSSAAASYGSSTTGTGGFPKVDASTQQSRDQSRRGILQRELASEEKLLAEARQEALRLYANSPASQLSSDKVQLHERNIAALRKEISKLK